MAGSRLKSAAVALTLLGIGGATGVLLTRFEAPHSASVARSAGHQPPILASVREGTLDQPENLTGTVGAADVGNADVPAAVDGAVVTAVYAKVGDTITSGSRLVDVQDRPVFIFANAFPFFRDLEYGLTGPDVSAIQDGLSARGFAIDAGERGRFGDSTAAAVTAHYRASLSPPPAPPAALASELAQAAADVASTPSDDATTRLSSLQARADHRIPLAELASARALPGIIETNLPVGRHAVGQPGVRIGTGGIVITSEVSQRVSQRFPVNSAVKIAVAGRSFTGTTTGLALIPDDSTEGATTSEPRYSMTLAADGLSDLVATPSVDFALSGSDESTLLLVPSTAVVQRHGDSFVLIARGSAFSEVEIRVLGSREAVVAVSSDQLHAGDQVRIDSASSLSK